MNRIFFYLFLITLSLICFSQNYTEIGGGSVPRIAYRLQTEYAEAEGSPFLFDTWRKGKIIYTDSTISDIIRINLDLTTNKFIIKRDNSMFILPISDSVKEVEIGAYRFIRIMTMENESIFMNVVAGKSKLLLLELITSQFLKGEPSKGYIQAKKDRFRRKTSFFLFRTPDTLLELSSKRIKTICNEIPDHSVSIQKFEKIKGRRIRSIEDLKQLINYLDSIEE